MKKTIESTVTNLGSIRAGRAQPSMLDRVFVDYYDTPTPLQQLASVSLQGSSSIIVSPFDKSCLKDIEKAIIESDVGMMPNNDGEKIRLNVPTLTEERRKELAKSCKSLGEEGQPLNLTVSLIRCFFSVMCFSSNLSLIHSRPFCRRYFYIRQSGCSKHQVRLTPQCL